MSKVSDKSKQADATFIQMMSALPAVEQLRLAREVREVCAIGPVVDLPSLRELDAAIADLESAHGGQRA